MSEPSTSIGNAPETRVKGRAWRRFRRSTSAWIGASIVGLFAFMAVSADWVAPYAPDISHRLEPGQAREPDNSDATFAKDQPPSREFWLGTDENAKDTLSRVIHGSRLSLLAGVLSILLAVSIGVPSGAIAGYSGGWLDAAIMRTVDVALAFPALMIALLVAMAFRSGWEAVIVAVGLINVPTFVRQVRATVLTIRNLEFVAASRALGATHFQVLVRAILPGIVSPVIVLATLGLGAAILEVAGLSFLGVSGDPTEPEWGSMLHQASKAFFENRTLWPVLGPGVAISVTILGFNLLGDGLRDALDPKLEGHG